MPLYLVCDIAARLVAVKSRKKATTSHTVVTEACIAAIKASTVSVTAHIVDVTAHTGAISGHNSVVTARIAAAPAHMHPFKSTATTIEKSKILQIMKHVIMRVNLRA